MSADNTSPTVNQGTGGSSAWKVDGTGGTFPISGSVAVTNGAGASAVNIQDGGNSITVDGSVTVTQSTASNLKVDLSGTAANATAILVTGTGGTFPISGTVAVTQSTSPWVTSNTPTRASITAAGGSFASSGNNTVITPSNSLHLSYISLSAAAANTAAVICIVKFTTGGSTLYEVQLLPGAIWAHNIGGGSSYVTGTSGQALVVNLDSAQTVYYSIEYADV